MAGVEADTPHLAVAICTHDPKPEYIARVLDALAQQTLTQQSWSMTIVDNASSSELASLFDVRWHVHGRVVREERLGLTHARLRAIAETASDVIVFVDDDNVLEPDYLEKAVEISEEHPDVGAWGGQLIPEFERQPAPEVMPLIPSLGVRELWGDEWSTSRGAWNALPYGAGLCVRREVAEAYAQAVGGDPLRSGLGVRGELLIRCEDIDLAFTATDLGLCMGTFERLRLTHLIGAARVTPDYLLRLVEGNGYSFEILGAVRGPTARLYGRSQLLSLVRASLVRGAFARKVAFRERVGQRRAIREISRLRGAR